MNDEKTIRLDRMRYTKNTLASTLAIVSILFDVFFFISIYESNVASWYYNILIGASILYNLIFLLAALHTSSIICPAASLKDVDPLKTGVTKVCSTLSTKRREASILMS